MCAWRRRFLIIFMIDLDHGEILPAKIPVDTAFQFIDDLIVRKLRAAGNGDVEDQVCPGVPADHAEIMDAQCAVKISDNLIYLLLHFQNFLVVGDDGIHVDGGGTVELFLKLMFDMVDLFMDRLDIPLRVNLCMERDHQSAGTVIMYDKVVDIVDQGMGNDDLPDLLDKFLLGRLSQKKVHGFLQSGASRIQDKDPHKYAEPAVQNEAGKVADQCGGQDQRGGDRVAETVHGGGLHGGAVYFAAYGTVVIKHIDLYHNGGGKDTQYKRAAVHGFRMEDLFHGGFCQLEAHDQDRNRNEKAGYVFHPSVSERMFRIGLLSGNPESDERDNGGACVGKIVEGVGRDGDGIAQNTGDPFSEEKKQVQADPHSAAECAVRLTHLGRRIVFPVLYKYGG